MSPQVLPSSGNDADGPPLSSVHVQRFVLGSQLTAYVWPFVCS